MDLFHATFNRVSDFPIEANTGTFGLMDRAAVDALNQLPERNRYFPGLRSWVGYQTAEISYDRQERAAGPPGDAQIKPSFTVRPLALTGRICLNPGQHVSTLVPTRRHGRPPEFQRG